MCHSMMLGTWDRDTVSLQVCDGTLEPRVTQETQCHSEDTEASGEFRQ